MASKTFGKVFNKVKNLAGYSALSFSDNNETVLLIKELINDKVKYINNLVKGYIYTTTKTTTTVASQTAYAIPSGTDKINYISITYNDREYFPEYIGNDQFNSLKTFNSDSSSDIPLYYTIDNNVVSIYPTPATSSNVISFNVNPITTNLTTTAGSTDENTSIAIKEGWEEVVEYSVLSDLFLQMEDSNSSNIYTGKYNKLIQQYKNEMNNPTSIIISNISPVKRTVDVNSYTEITHT